MNEKTKNEDIKLYPTESKIDECDWCNSTGEIEKNRKHYWAAVLIIILIIFILYTLSI